MEVDRSARGSLTGLQPARQVTVRRHAGTYSWTGHYHRGDETDQGQSHNGADGLREGRSAEVFRSDATDFQLARQLFHRRGENEYRIERKIKQRHQGRSQEQGAWQVALRVAHFAANIDGGVPP